jgi:cytidylate kinase
MSITMTSDRLGEALLRAQMHWQETPKGESAPPPLTVAITREAGTNAGLVAARLGARLGWPVYERELLQRIAEEMGLRTQLVESVDEKRSSYLLSCLRAFASPDAVSEEAYLSHLTSVVFSLAAHGECILVGRGTAQFLPAESTLRVRLVAPLNDRIQGMQQRYNLSFADAARRVADTDHARAEFVRSVFHKDPNDPSGYDLLLNTARFTPDECAALIEQALRVRQSQIKTMTSKPRVA